MVMLAGLLGGALVLWQWDRAEQRRSLPGGWGIDAVITRHVDKQSCREYLGEIRRSGVGILRERDVGRLAGSVDAPGRWHGDVRAKFQAIKRSGLKVVAFAHSPFGLKSAQPGNQLPEDLLTVFEHARFLGREFLGLVDVWEMVGEPDIGFCTDLPDRVAAYQKAMYLGIRRGAAEAQGKAEGGKPMADSAKLTASPLVLMGALGMPPSPWLERAARNGLLDYTDAYNFHFYGHASDLTGVIESHRAFLKRREREMPLWITECGVEAVAKSDYHNPERRKVQADFTLVTARQALAADDVAVFMPFILAHRNDPYAMTASPSQPFTAWMEYARFTRENPWPERPLLRTPHRPNPVVVQWLPDNRTTLPRKTGGTYRFIEGGLIKGEIRIYNFGEQVVRGHFTADCSDGADAKEANATISLPKTGEILEVEPLGMVSLPVVFEAKKAGSFRVWIEGGFAGADGSRSLVFFGLEQERRDLIEAPLPLAPPTDGRIAFPQSDIHEFSGKSGVWTTINGLRAEATEGYATFWINEVDDDPLKPTMAVAAVGGLPESGYIRMLLDKSMTARRRILLTLVDDRGQRYSIWENYSADYYGSRQDIRINLEDLHLDFWGRAGAAYEFDPARVRELHLRLYLNDANDGLGVRLSLLRPRSGVE